MASVMGRFVGFSAAVMCAGALCLGMGGCAADSGTTTNTPQETVIGTADQSAFALKMTNGSNESVVSMEVRLPGEEGFSSAMLSDGQKLANGETATIYIPNNGTTGDEYAVDIKVVFNNGGTSTLHYLDLKDFSACTLLLQGKVGYVMYQSTAAGRMVSTLELQQYYYNLEDPDAAARDKAEEEEEKRRLEKLEEDLKSFEESSNTSNSSNGNSSSTSNSTNEAENDEVQRANVEDDPLELDSDGREYLDDSDDYSDA